MEQNEGTGQALECRDQSHRPNDGRRPNRSRGETGRRYNRGIRGETGGRYHRGNGGETGGAYQRRSRGGGLTGGGEERGKTGGKRRRKVRLEISGRRQAMPHLF